MLLHPSMPKIQELCNSSFSSRRPPAVAAGPLPPPIAQVGTVAAAASEQPLPRLRAPSLEQCPGSPAGAAGGQSSAGTECRQRNSLVSLAML